MVDHMSETAKDYHRNPVVGLRLPAETRDWLRQQVASTGRSAASIVTAAINEYRDHHQNGETR